MLINRASLSKTVDAISAALFDGRTLAAVERGEAARWIAGRQGLPAAYGEHDSLIRSEDRRTAHKCHTLELCPGRVVSYELRIGRCKRRLGPLFAFGLVEIERRQLEP
jgi:hypothetical protein